MVIKNVMEIEPQLPVPQATALPTDHEQYKGTSFYMTYEVPENKAHNEIMQCNSLLQKCNVFVLTPMCIRVQVKSMAVTRANLVDGN
jgi:hypothetical protein